MSAGAITWTGDWQISTTLKGKSSLRGVDDRVAVHDPEVTRSHDQERSPATFSSVVPSAAKEPLDRQVASARQELRRYGGFDRGWDGYDGLPFPQEVLAAANEALSVCEAAFRDISAVPEEVTPGPASDGTVDVEVAYAPRRLILTFDADTLDRMHVYYEDADLGVASETDAARGKDSLERWSGWLLRQDNLP